MKTKFNRSNKKYNKKEIIRDIFILSPIILLIILSLLGIIKGE